MRLPWQRKKSFEPDTPAASVSFDVGPIDVTPTEPSGPPTVQVDQLATAVSAVTGSGYANPNERGALRYSWNDGNKYPGGMGPTEITVTDYWTLRQHSDTLFRRNLYARGLLRRLVTNVINTGLVLEAFPDEELLGFPEDGLTEWSERVEARFQIWANNPRMCDYHGEQTFAQLQATVEFEAMIGGDVLLIMHQNRVTKLPQIQIVNGSRVDTPYPGKVELADGHKIVHGVELDAAGKKVAYWIITKDGTGERVPAVGPRTGRRMAWLVYGTDKRMDDLRGEPLLSIIMQSLRDVDRYRDSAQRKAVINSILAGFIEKTQDKMGTTPLSAGATRRDQFTNDNDGTSNAPRQYDIARHIPGLFLQELQTGEKPTVHQSGAEVQFGPFEEAIIQAVAWAHEIPPEILRLAFSNNYSASQAAINEFKMFLNMKRTQRGLDVCQPVYVEWLISEALLRNIDAPGLLEAWRDPRQYDVFGAWVESDWSGAIKPSTDLVKQTRGMETAVDKGWTTNERASRELFGQKFRKNIKRLKRENQLIADARRPLAEFEQEFGRSPGDVGAEMQARVDNAVADALDDAQDA